MKHIKEYKTYKNFLEYSNLDLIKRVGNKNYYDEKNYVIIEEIIL